MVKIYKYTMLLTLEKTFVWDLISGEKNRASNVELYVYFHPNTVIKALCYYCAAQSWISFEFIFRNSIAVPIRFINLIKSRFCNKTLQPSPLKVNIYTSYVHLCTSSHRKSIKYLIERCGSLGKSIGMEVYYVYYIYSLYTMNLSCVKLNRTK